MNMQVTLEEFILYKCIVKDNGIINCQVEICSKTALK